METRIRKQRLLDILQDNRAEHVKFVEEAKVNYAETAQRVLQEQLDSIRQGNAPKLQKITDLVEPISYVSQYDDVIEMLTLDTREEIVLSQAEFIQYVLDRWSWGRHFAALASNYTSGATVTNMSNKYGV